MRHVTPLRVAAWLNITLAAAHVLCMPWLDAAFRLYGIDGMMSKIVRHGCFWPYLITLVVAACFALCGLYALSADGRIRRLPLLWVGIFVIAAVFLLRAGIGCLWMLEAGQCAMIGLTSVVISGGIGLLYLLGAVITLRRKVNK